MKLRLFRRHFGIHHFIRECKIPIKFKDVVAYQDDPNVDFLIKEDLILQYMPKNFIGHPETVLLTVGNDSGSTAQRHPIFFRQWGKYFDSFVLELSK